MWCGIQRGGMTNASCGVLIEVLNIHAKGKSAKMLITIRKPYASTLSMRMFSILRRRRVRATNSS